MMANAPTVCGKNMLFTTEEGCSDCEELEKRVRLLEECCANVQETLSDYGRRISALEECCDDVHTELDKKADRTDIVAGDNVTIERDGNTIIINSECECAGCTATKAELMNCLGVREVPMTLSDTDGADEEWYVLGRLTSETIGDGTCKCTKAELMSCLGIRELPMTITDTDSTTQNWYILGRRSSESSGDGNTVPGYNCNKWEMLNVMGYQEVSFTLGDASSSQTWTLLGRPKL